MKIGRRSRWAAVGGAVVLAAAVGTAAAASPQGTTPAPASLIGPVGSGSSVASTLASPSVPGTPTQRASAAVAGLAATAKGDIPSRLTLTVARGRTLVVTGVLSRASNGALIRNRAVKVYVRTADSGRWNLATTARTSARGRFVYDVRDRALLQFTLRFAGDRWFRPAASVTIVPDPSATGLKPAMITAIAKARAAAGRAGLRLVINSGYRSWSRQSAMFAAAVRRYGSARAARVWVLPPQESTHVRGLAVDIGTPATAAWLTVHGATFGLCRAYRNEAWHFEYRPDWITAFGGRCPAPVPVPGDPDPLSPAPRVAVRF